MQLTPKHIFLTCFVARMPHGTVERLFKPNIPDEDLATMILDLGLCVMFSFFVLFFCPSYTWSQPADSCV